MSIPPLSVLVQYVLPQHGLSHLMGWAARCRWLWFKNIGIRWFIRRYQVDMQEALEENVEAYPNFNCFFTRKLKSGIRPIVSGENEVASPVDGNISQIGDVQAQRIFQAKGIEFNLENLLGGAKQLTQDLQGGVFVTLYLAPKVYHRVHMPFTGMLREMIYIPGRLFSVNQRTTARVPHLFTRNERVVSVFDTTHGLMVVVLIGAMIVGSIETVWEGVVTPATSGKIRLWSYTKPAITLKKGDELGLFKMGSTVMVLFPRNTVRWNATLRADSAVKMGQLLGTINRET